MRNICFIFLQIAFLSTVYGQSTDDTIKTQTLHPVIIDGSRQVRDIRRLDDIQGTYNFSGKKSEVVLLSGQNNGLAEKYCRQLFAKIPGIFVYDVDGTGNQVNISARGLDPHRGWEFNIRKDGIITNTDMYGSRRATTMYRWRLLKE